MHDNTNKGKISGIVPAFLAYLLGKPKEQPIRKKVEKYVSKRHRKVAEAHQYLESVAEGMCLTRKPENVKLLLMDAEKEVREIIKENDNIYKIYEIGLDIHAIVCKKLERKKFLELSPVTNSEALEKAKKINSILFGAVSFDLERAEAGLISHFGRLMGEAAQRIVSINKEYR